MSTRIENELVVSDGNDDRVYTADQVITALTPATPAETAHAKTKAGVPTDGDFTAPTNGDLAVDTTNSKLYVRIGGAWVGVTVA